MFWSRIRKYAGTLFGHKTHTYCLIYIYLGLYNFSCKSKSSRLSELLTLLLCVLPAIFEAFIYHHTLRVPYSLLTEVSVLCYQPSYQECCHSAMGRKFAAANISLERWKQNLNSGNGSDFDSLFYEITS